MRDVKDIEAENNRLRVIARYYETDLMHALHTVRIDAFDPNSKRTATERKCQEENLLLKLKKVGFAINGGDYEHD